MFLTRKKYSTEVLSQSSQATIEIKLLKILALLGNGDKKASEQMYTILGDIVRKCDSASDIGNAILYESICCVSSLHPNPKLLEVAADAISKFLKSDSHNLKYLGIDALSRLIKLSPDIAELHQLAVIGCLEIPTTIIPLEMDQMQGSHLRHENCLLSILKPTLLESICR